MANQRINNKESNHIISHNNIFEFNITECSPIKLYKQINGCWILVLDSPKPEEVLVGCANGS